MDWGDVVVPSGDSVDRMSESSGHGKCMKGQRAYLPAALPAMAAVPAMAAALPATAAVPAMAAMAAMAAVATVRAMAAASPNAFCAHHCIASGKHACIVSCMMICTHSGRDGRSL